MSGLFASGRIVDFVLVLVAVEAVGLAVLYRRSGRGIAPGALVGFLGAGVALMLALRVALVGGWWGYVALFLLVAGVAHVWDLRSRWR
jgi:hypothetical protein